MRRAGLLCFLLLGACDGGPNALVPTMSASHEAPIVLAPPADGYQLTFGPFDVPNGDVQLCRTVKLDNPEPIAINRLDLKMLQGSHHFILFRSRQQANGTHVEYPDQVFDCKGTINFDEWDFLFDVNRKFGDDFRMAGDQAIIFPAHAQIMMQAHFLNASKGPVKATIGYDVLNMHKTNMQGVKHQLRGMFTVNTRLAIPAYTEDWRSNKHCSFSRSVYIVAMTGHFHHQGRTFRVTREDAGTEPQTPINEIYCSGPDCTDEAGADSNWDHPLFKLFDPPLLINGDSSAANEGVNFECSYDNSSDKTLYFGGLAETQEHCNLFFQYYVTDPSYEDPLACAEGQGGW